MIYDFVAMDVVFVRKVKLIYTSRRFCKRKLEKTTYARVVESCIMTRVIHYLPRKYLY